MAEAYIVDALRTPTGKRKGSLMDMPCTADLGAHVIRALVERNPIPDPKTTTT
jgi:acetyl-CoA C-acetyltransferase